MDPQNNPASSNATRRAFLKVAAAGTIAVAARAGAQTAPAATAASNSALPWYKRAIRWGQTNITEADIAKYDIPWWRQQWKRTELHGVIINAGGIFAYYPSEYALHYRAAGLGDRDLFGDLAKAAHDDGLCVLARMDSSKVHEPMFRAHHDWIGVDAAGAPHRSGEFYLTCINSPYYTEFLPDVMREIIELYKPEGITDNIWSGIERPAMCYCQYCARRFRDATSRDLPRRADWTDPVFRQWIDWNYARRIEQWDFNNTVTRTAGGKDCIWAGMNGASVVSQSNSFRDMKGIFARSEIIMLDNQSRSNTYGLQENALHGKMVHSVLGWDKFVPESMAMYQHGQPMQFRLSTKSPPEVRMWMASGIAGGIQPWWHHVAAYHEDRRMYKIAEPMMKWHKANEEFLIHRRPIAAVGIGWSQRNHDFFGRDSADELVDQPFRGFMQALVRARINHVPVHMDYLDRDAAALGLSVLILPNLGLMSDVQIAAVRKFVQNGGSVVASGQASLYDNNGDPRADFALAEMFGVKGARPVAGGGRGRGAAAGGAGGGGGEHTYLRLTPELRIQTYGPKNGSEPTITGKRHAVLAGFDETDILPYGGTMAAGLIVDPKAQVVMTYIPPMPATPPEIVYMRTPRTDIAGLVLSEARGSGAGRGSCVAYFAADIDRRFAIDNFPDHGDLLANVVRWAAGESLPLAVEGPGLVNCELYRQGANTGAATSGAGRLVLHIVNVTSAGTWRAPVHELMAVGPLAIRVKLPDGITAKTARTLVGDKPLTAKVDGGWISFELPTVLDHEVVVIEA